MKTCIEKPVGLLLIYPVAEEPADGLLSDLEKDEYIMREEYVEILVKVKRNMLYAFGMIFLYIVCGLVFLFGLLGGGFLAMIIGVVIGFLGYLLGSKSSIEYEYTFCGKEIDVDVIYNATKRKKVLTIDLNKLEAMVRVQGNKMGEYKNRQVVVKDFSSKKPEQAQDVYALFMEGNVEYLIEPGDRLINALSYVCPRKIYKD